MPVSERPSNEDSTAPGPIVEWQSPDSSGRKALRGFGAILGVLIILVPLALGLWFGLGLAGRAKTTEPLPLPPASTWTTYPSVPGRYSAIFPGPTVHDSTIHLNDPGVLTEETDQWGSLDTGLKFSVRWSDFPTGYAATHLQSIYDYTQSETLALNDATLILVRDISVEGQTGREFVVSTKDLRHVTTSLCFVGDRYYTWGAFFATPGDTRAFLDSFRTLGP